MIVKCKRFYEKCIDKTDRGEFAPAGNRRCSETVMGLLRSLESPCLPQEIGVDRQLLRDTFLYCKEVRARYTLLQLAWDLGVLEEFADQISEDLESAK